MSEIYKGHRITATIMSPYAVGKVAHVIFHVHRKEGDEWKLAREQKLYGPFDSLEDARNCADTVARKWIDQQEASR